MHRGCKNSSESSHLPFTQLPAMAASYITTMQGSSPRIDIGTMLLAEPQALFRLLLFPCPHFFSLYIVLCILVHTICVSTTTPGTELFCHSPELPYAIPLVAMPPPPSDPWQPLICSPHLLFLFNSKSVI